MLSTLFHFHLEMGAAPSPTIRALRITVAAAALLTIAMAGDALHEVTITVAGGPLHTITLDADEV